MKVKEIVKLIDGQIICGEDRMDESVVYAFSSDLMSDVLTIKVDNFILITGLANIQSIRTAEISDVQFILFVRGKKVTEEMISLAKDNGMAIIQTDYSLYKTSGILYGAGLMPVY
jgi:predicted transcriptional regulator